MPCNAKHTEIDKQGVFTVSEECVKEHEEQLKYIGVGGVLEIMYNYERFDPTKYGDYRIVKESMISFKKINPYEPSFYLSFFKHQELEDEIDLL